MELVIIVSVWLLQGSDECYAKRKLSGSMNKVQIVWFMVCTGEDTL